MNVSENFKSYIIHIFKNPIVVFGILTILVSLFLFIKVHFNIPEYYNDRQLAQSFASNASLNIDEISEEINKLINPKFKFYNKIFQMWGLIITLFIITLIFKINKFEKFLHLKLKKNFIYLWLNIAYIVYAICFWNSFIFNLNSEVYYWASDSIMIPMVIVFACIFYFGIAHYIINNILTFLTYNKFKHNLLQVIWIINGIWTLLLILSNITAKFTYFNLVMNFCNFVWLIIILYSIKLVKNNNTGSS